MDNHIPVSKVEKVISMPILSYAFLLITVNLTALPSDTTLNTFLRDYAALSGTKFMCQEGGCGVCICVVTGKHPVSGEYKSWAVNSVRHPY